MDKKEIIKQVKQYGYTYVVRCKFHEDGYETIGYYCSDSEEFPTEDKIEEHFELEEGDDFKITYQVANDFNSDDYLSDMIIYMLAGECKLEDADFAKYHVAYIREIYNECWFKEDEGDEYKRNVLSSVLKYMDLQKRSPMVKYVAYAILKIFNIEKDNNLSVRKQIELILDAQANGNILNQLFLPECIKSAQRHLDEIGEAYKITEEKSLYRIGVLFLQIYNAFSCSYLKPRFFKDDKQSNKRKTKKNKWKIRCYGAFMKLLASYYGINTPTYGERVLKNYKERGEKYPLYSTIKQEHNNVWLSFY